MRRAFLVSVAVFTTLSGLWAQVPPDHRVGRERMGDLRPGPVLPRCPDLAADRIDFSLLKRTGKNAGTIRITGVVRNTGLADYRSGARQQEVLLYEDDIL